MNVELFNCFVKAALIILSGIFTYVLLPYIKSHIDKDKLDKLQSYAEFAVRFAEQKFKEAEGTKKKRYVYDYILNKSKSLNLNLTEEDIDVLVEGVVNMVKYDYT